MDVMLMIRGRLDSDDSDHVDSDSQPEQEWHEVEGEIAARSIIESLSRELDGPEGPSDKADDIQELIRHLWFGKHFNVNTCDAVDRGQVRLAEVLAEIRWLRSKWYSAEEPVGDAKFSVDEVTEIHNFTA